MKKILYEKVDKGRMNKPFTLIEILVVVAIIGILASLLLPMLSKSRKKAKIAVCKSNQKQINYALVMFTDDNDGYLPAPSGHVSWDDMLSGYDGRPTLTDAHKAQNVLTKSDFGDSYGELYRCPLSEGNTSANLEMTYAITVKGSHKAQQGLMSTAASTTALSEVSDADETIMLFDYNRSSSYTRMGRNVFNLARCTDLYKWEVLESDGMMHGGLDVNYLFVDGHVQSMDFYATFVPYGAGSWDVRGGMWDAHKDDPNN